MDEDFSSNESGWTKYMISDPSEYTIQHEYFSSGVVDGDDHHLHGEHHERRKNNCGYYKKHDMGTEDVDSLTSDASSGPSYDVLPTVKHDDEQDSCNKKFPVSGKKTMIGGGKERKETSESWRKQSRIGVKGKKQTTGHGKQR